MKQSLKNRLLAYLKSNNDGSDEANKLIKELTYECNHADCDSHFVSVYDLSNLGDYYQKKLRKALNKAEGEEWNMDDCEIVAEELADYICENYGDDIINTIESM